MKKRDDEYRKHHFGDTGIPRFGEDRPLPSFPDPTASGIELHHDGSSSTGSDAFIDEQI